VHLRTTSKRNRAAVLALVAGTTLAALVALLTVAAPTYSINTHRTGRVDNRGFPLFYTDDRGVHLRICEDGTRRCLRATRADLRAPDGENFYWLATATMHSRRGPIDVEFALEAAFGGARGQKPIVFDRIRIRGHLRQKGAYILDHPYGSTRFRAITPREQRNVDFTVDRNCSLAKNGRCRGRIDNFLRAKRHPDGYIGRGGRRTHVVGGTVRNFLQLRTADGQVLGRTGRFAIMGKRAGGVRN
jgi:hypothetical protein